MSNVPLYVQRKEALDLRRHEFIDEVLPTLQVQRAAVTNNPAANAVIGSHRIGPGSMIRLTEITVFVGSAQTAVAVTHTGTPLTPFEQRGTRDLFGFPSRGETTRIYDLDKNAPAFGAGTLQFKAIDAGTRRYGVAFKGIEYPLSQGVSTV